MLRLIRPPQSLRERPSGSSRRWLQTSESEYRCCLCLHVKTGTLLLGLWQIWVQLFIVSFLLAVVINPNLLECMRNSSGHQQHKGAATHASAATTTTSSAYVNVNGHHLIGTGQRAEAMRRQDHALLLLIGLISLLLAVLMVTGAVKERAKYIMPYFCMQLFDFIINCLTVVGYFSYLPDVKRWLTNHHWPHDAAVRKFLLGLDDATLGFLMLIVCMLYLMLKAYLLGMVWACYKYLVRKETGQLNESGSPSGFEYDPSHSGSSADWEASTALLLAGDSDTTAGLLPPKYEDALKSPANMNAPPPYFPGNARPARE